MLWKKEKIKGRMIYVEIIDTGIGAIYSSCNQFMTEILSNVHETSTTKDNTLSDAVLHNAVLMRALNADSEKILELLNKAICYAEVGSEKLGGAYGFRAQCFFRMKQYASSLTDIELAKKHNYPSQKRSSLETLKNDCLKQLAIEGRKKSAMALPKLSLPADAKIPCFAEGLEVRQSKKYGKHIVTTRALEIGQTVIIEEAYCIRADNSQNYSQCANCFERKANLIPCKNCAAVMFCSQNCYDVGHQKFHAIECRKRGVHTNWEAARRIVLQTVISAIKSFPNIKNMMEVVENFRNRKANNEQNYYSDPSIRAYMQFFALGQSVEHTPIMQDFQFIDYTKTIHSAIATNPEFRSMFGSLEESRFLAHLILHHFYIVDANGFDALSLLHGTYLTELGTDLANGSGFTYAHGIYVNSSQLNHSCQPNIARIFIGNKLIGKVIRPIKRGEQLFVSYLNPMNLLKPLAYRQNRLGTIYYFECKCKSCTSDFPPFKSSGEVNVDISICRLLDMFNPSPDKNPFKNSLKVNRGEMLIFEQSAIKYLQINERIHPTDETLLIQFLLMQIWNNLGR